MDVKSYVYAKQVFFYLHLWFSCSREKIAPSPRQIHLLRLKKEVQVIFPDRHLFFLSLSLLSGESVFLSCCTLFDLLTYTYLFILCPDIRLTFLFKLNKQTKRQRLGRALTCLLRWRNQQPTNSNCHCCCAVPFQKIFNAILKSVVCFIFGFWKKIKTKQNKKLKWNFEIFFKKTFQFLYSFFLSMISPAVCSWVLPSLRNGWLSVRVKIKIDSLNQLNNPIHSFL